MNTNAADFEACSNASLKRDKSLFKENQKLNSEADTSRRLSQVVDAILGPCKNGDKCLWINSCLKNDEGEHPRTTNIIVPMEVQLSRNYDGIRQNRLRLASAVVQIMNDDVRRTFIFGITVEEHFADDRDLGFDPNIALKSNTKRQFTYTVHGQTGLRRFLTTHSISENRAFRRMI
ncbi:hypothetical protein H1R20_g15571, partial [Candolleomyces eurysporus]